MFVSTEGDSVMANVIPTAEYIVYRYLVDNGPHFNKAVVDSHAKQRAKEIVAEFDEKDEPIDWDYLDHVILSEYRDLE